MTRGSDGLLSLVSEKKPLEQIRENSHNREMLTLCHNIERAESDQISPNMSVMSAEKFKF